MNDRAVLNDFYALLLSPLLPRFEVVFSMSHTASMTLLVFCNVVGSMMQPLWGFAGDKAGRKVFVLAGTILAAVFMSLIGFSWSMSALVGMLLPGMTGIALFHPNAAAMASQATRRMAGTGMSLFVMSGAIGIAVAPAVITRIVEKHGLGATWCVMPIGLVAAVVFFFVLKEGGDGGESVAREERTSPPAEDRETLFLLFSAVALRSAAIATFSSLIPIYAKEIGMALGAGGRMQSLCLLGTFAGGVGGGFIADRTSRHAIMLSSSILCVPFLYFFTRTHGGVSLMLLGFGSAVLAAGTPLHLLAAQRLRPQSASTVSGIMMGLAWSVGGMMLPVFGFIADVLSTQTALGVASAAPLLGAIMIVRRRRLRMEPSDDEK